MDKIGPISEVRAHLPEVVDAVRKTGKRYVITRQGKAVAVVISPEELEALEARADSELKKILKRLTDATQVEDFQKSWKSFQQWEKKQKGEKNKTKVLREVDQTVDFFLKRHPQPAVPPDVRGIELMRAKLSRLKNRA